MEGDKLDSAMVPLKAKGEGDEALGKKDRPVLSSSSDDGNSAGTDIIKKAEATAKASRSVEAPAVPYRDYSTEHPDTMEKEGAQNFPMKLHSILSNLEFQDIIAWLPHGRAWRILQHKAFEERVIPLYFRHGRYSSFAVNGWNFRRITCGPDYNAYYHEMFLRGKPHLCRSMRRISAKEGKKLETPNETDAPAPDFYAISREFPLPELPGFRDGKSTSGEAVPTVANMGHGRFRPVAPQGDSEMAALERRRQEILQQITMLQGGGPVPPVPMQQQDPNSQLLQLLGHQANFGGIHQAQGSGQANLASILASLTGNQPPPPPQPVAMPQNMTLPPGVNLGQLLSNPSGLAALQQAGFNIGALIGQVAAQQFQAPPPPPPQPQMSSNWSELLANAQTGGGNNAQLLQHLQNQLRGQHQHSNNAPASNAPPTQAPGPSPADALSALQRQLAMSQNGQTGHAMAPPATGMSMFQQKIQELAAAGTAIPSEILSMFQSQLAQGQAQQQNLPSSTPPSASPAPQYEGLSDLHRRFLSATGQSPSMQPAQSPNANSAPAPTDPSALLAELQRKLMAGNQLPSSNSGPSLDMHRQLLQAQLSNNPQLAAALGLGGAQQQPSNSS